MLFSSQDQAAAAAPAAAAAVYTVGYTTNQITTADGMKYEVVRHRMAYHTIPIEQRQWTTWCHWSLDYGP